MKQLLTVLTAFLLLLVAGCTTDFEPKGYETHEPSDEYLQINADASEFADLCMTKIFGKTRATNLIVKDIQLRVNRISRASYGNVGIDTLIAVNYASNEGYVLLGKKNQLKKLVAISDEGNINFGDTVFNKGLKNYLKDISNNLVVRLSTFIGDKPGRDGPVVPKDPEVTKYTPVLNKNVRNWHQSTPYNYYCPSMWCDFSGNYENAYVGCVPLSIGMVMSHYEWPTSHEGISFDWHSIKSEPYDYINGKPAYLSIASLVYTLGSNNNLKTKYNVFPKGSSTAAKNEIPVFKKWGYCVSGNWSEHYNYNYIAGNGPQRKPILVIGTDAEDEDLSHQWVADGSMYVNYFENNDDTITHTDHYLYFVWGWGGSSNGYYLMGGATPDYGWIGDPFEGSVNNSKSYIDLLYFGDYTPNK